MSLRTFLHHVLTHHPHAHSGRHPSSAHPHLQVLEDRSTPALGGGFTAAGILGEYFDNPDLHGSPSFTRQDVRLDFDWSKMADPGGSTSPGFADVQACQFSVRWTGQIVPQFSETYTFVASSQDGFRLLLRPEGETSWQTVIDNWSPSANSQGIIQGQFTFTAGCSYDVRAEYRAGEAPGAFRLAWESPSTPLSVIEPLGIVGGHVDSYNPVVFADVMKTGRAVWGLPSNDLGSGASLDSHGWPTSDAANVVWEGRVGSEMAGTYLLQFVGQAEVSYSGGLAVFRTGETTVGNALPRGIGYDPATNTTRVYLDVIRNDGFLSLTFRQTQRSPADPASNTGVTDVRLMRPTAIGSTTPYPVGTVFTDSFKEANERYVALRWNDTNGAGESTWNQRTLPGWKNVIQNPLGGKWAYEYQILLANELGKDLYLTIPIKASNEYLQNLALLLRYGSDGVQPYASPQADPVYPGLNSNLRVYLEVSNEVWNTASAYPQTTWADEAARAAAAAPLGSPERAEWNIINYDGTLPSGGGMHMVRLRRWEALRTVRASEIFRTVFEPENASTGMDRVRVLLEYMYDNLLGTASNSLQFIDHYFNNGDGQSHVTTPHPVNYYLWGAGGAGYYGSGNPNGVMSSDPFESKGDFELTSVDPGSTTSTATGWSFSGNAGIYHDSSLLGAVSSRSLGSSRTTSADAAYGLSFTVGSNPIAVYEVGRWVTTGNQGTHTIRILRASDRVAVAYADVNAKGATGGQFAFAKLSKPVLLAANTTYYLMSSETRGGDTFLADTTTVDSTGDLTVTGSVSATYSGAYWDTTTWACTTVTSGSRAFGPVTFRFTKQPIESLGFVPASPGGAQSAFLGEGGTATTTITVPADGTYAVAFQAAGRAGQAMQLPIDVEVDGERITPHYVLGSGAQVTANPSSWVPGTGLWGTSTDRFSAVTSAPVYLTAGTHTVQFIGRKYSWTADDARTYLDQVTLASLDAIFDGGMPSTGQATGQSGTGQYAKDMLESTRYAQAHGLHPVAYEFGWSLGGDFGATPLQNHAKYIDPRAGVVNGTAIDLYAQAGGSLLMMGTYQQWSLADTENASNSALLRGVDDRNDRLQTEPTNGVSVPGYLTPANHRWDMGLQGTTITTNGFMAWNILVPTTGQYTLALSTTSGGTSRLVVDGGKSVVTQASGSTLTTHVFLTAGLHSINVADLAGAFQVNQIVLSADGAPTSPAITGVSDGNGSVTLAWSEVPGAVGYRIRYGTSPGCYSEWVSAGNRTTATIGGLAHGSVWYFAVVAENSNGLSLPSPERAVSVLTDGQVGKLALWDFSTLPAGTSSPDSATATNTSRLTVSSLTRGAGLAASSSSWGGSLRKGRFASEPAGSAGNRYGANLAEAISLRQYYQFSVSPGAGVAGSLSKLAMRPYFQNNRSTLGVAVQYSLDGVNFLTARDALVPQTSSSPFTVDLSGIAELQGFTTMVTFRIYLYGAGKYEVTGLGQGSGNAIELTGMLLPQLPSRNRDGEPL